MDDTKRTPKYQQIADELHRDIVAGKYPPGAKIPGEQKIMDDRHVSRTTARDALAVLRDEGLTEARRGSGVYVRDYQPTRRVANDRLRAERWGPGRSLWHSGDREQPRPEDVAVKTVPAVETIAQTLGIPAGSPVVLTTVVHRAEGRPVERSRSHVPAELVQDTALADGGTDPDEALAAAGHTIERVREEVRCRMPLPIERAALGIASGTPVVLIAATAFDQAGTPVEVTETTLDASRFILEYNMYA